VIVWFVDIGGIDDHHCLNFLFIMRTNLFTNKTKHADNKSGMACAHGAEVEVAQENGVYYGCGRNIMPSNTPLTIT
jgi:hypothetical protein